MSDTRLVLLLAVVIAGAFCCVAAGDTPGDPYAVDLGPGNEDLEEKIHFIPWTRLAGFHTQVKDASQVDFAGRDLRLAVIRFELKGLYGARFDNCKLDGSDLTETTLVNCSFRNASLQFCQIELVGQDTELLSDFTGADITGAWIHGLAGESLTQTQDYRSKKLVSNEFRGGGLSGVSFRGFQLHNVMFTGPLFGCNFSEATLDRMIIRNNLSKEQLFSTTNYRHKDLSTLLIAGYHDSNHNCVGWDFSECRLAYFKNCDLKDASFDNAYFWGARGLQLDFLDTSPLAPSLTVDRYYGAARLSDVGFDNCDIAEWQLTSTVNWKKRYLRRMHLKNMCLDGWDFSGMDMRGADLSGSSLKGTSFAGARTGVMRLDGCRDLTLAQLLESVRNLQGESQRIQARKDLLAYHWNVDFTDLTDDEKKVQESLRRQHSKKKFVRRAVRQANVQRRTLMRKSIVGIRFTSLAVPAIVLSVLCVAGISGQVMADHPSHSVTVKLGPGNEDVENKLANFRTYSDFNRRVESLRGSDMSGRDFRRAVLHLELRSLQDVNFDGADLTGADIREAGFDNCSFRRARLRKIYSTGYEEIRANCDLTDADISGSYMVLTAEQLRSTSNYKHKDLSLIGLQGDYSGVDFSRFSLRRTLFHCCRLGGSSFANADIGGATFWFATTSRSDQETFTEFQLCSTASYGQRDLDGTRFIGCDFSGIDFSDCNLGFFWNCELRGTDFSNAEFCEPQSSEAMTTHFRGANSRGGYYASYGFIACDLTAEQFYSTRTYRCGAMPSSFVLEEMDLDGWDLSGMDLRGVSFRMSSLRGANLENARGGHLEQAIGLTAEQIKSTWNYRHGVLAAGTHTGFSIPESIRKELP